MGLSLMHAPENAGGTFTSGGSESIFLAMLAAREKAGVAKPNIVIPDTAHLTFDRAAWYLGMEVRRVPVDAERRSDVAAMAAAMDANTAALVGSAPNYPFGGIDRVAELGALATERGVWLHGGSIAERAGDEYFNTSLLFAPDGALAAAYRKIHLFGFEGGETVLMSGGDELFVVETPLGPTGLATCYDLRFPELFRALVEGGATAVLLTSGWPTPRIEHWDVLTQARAIENQAWFIACNEVGQQPGIRLGGHSVVIDPRGSVVAKAGAGPEVLYVDVDPDAAAQWRAEFPVLGDIRIG
jgi:predicted amidohydrolase